MHRFLAPPIAGLIAVLALAGCTGSLHLNGPAPDNAASVAVPLGGTASVPLAGRAAAQLHIVAGFTTVNVTTAAIGSALIRASAPLGSGLLPIITLTGNVVSIGDRQAPSGSGTGALDVVLNPDVRWQVSLDGGASVAVVDLARGRVSEVDLTQGVSSLEVTLPAQPGTIAVALSAGVSSLRVHVSGNEPIRATFAAGAGSAIIDGVAHSGIAAGTSFASAGWQTSPARVDVECAAGVSAVVADQV